MQTIEIRSAKVTFDKEKTKAYRTAFNQPCDCLYCRNYYREVGKNSELVAFLSNFGIDYSHTEEVFSWDVEKKRLSLIHCIGHYGVFGRLEAEDFAFEDFGVKISFQSNAMAPCDREEEYFWICVEGDISCEADP